MPRRARVSFGDAFTIVAFAFLLRGERVLLALARRAARVVRLWARIRAAMGSSTDVAMTCCTAGMGRIFVPVTTTPTLGLVVGAHVPTFSAFFTSLAACLLAAVTGASGASAAAAAAAWAATGDASGADSPCGDENFTGTTGSGLCAALLPCLAGCFVAAAASSMRL